MQEQTNLSDEKIGVACAIKITSYGNGKYEYRFAKLEDEKFDAFDNGDNVYVLTPSEQSQLMELINNAKTTPPTTNADEVSELKQDLETKTQTINEKDITITNLQSRIDELDKQLDESIDASELGTIQQELNETNSQLDSCKNTLNEYESKIADFGKAIELKDSEILKQNKTIGEQEKEILHLQTIIANDGDKEIEVKKEMDSMNAEIIRLSKINTELEMNLENEKAKLLKNQNEIKTSLNENLIATKTELKETKQEMQSDFQNKEKELKETIKKQQSHIDELTKKYQSLLGLKENIPQKQHYDEIQALKDKLSNAEKELESTKASIETKLATQKSELSVEHSKEISTIQSNYADEKAQLFVAYNQDLDNLKLQYNNLANEYNTLLNELNTITKWNAIFDNRHEKIRKDKEQVELEVISPSEQLPPSDENVVEFVPKDKKQE